MIPVFPSRKMTAVSFFPLFALAVAALTAIADGTRAAEIPAPPPGRLDGIRSFVIHCADDDDEQLDALGRHDLVVLPLSALGNDPGPNVARLRAAGTQKILGRFNAFELCGGLRERFAPAMFLRIDNRPWRTAEGHPAIDLDNPSARAWLARLVRVEVLDKGADGVFLDTLCCIEDESLPDAARSVQLQGLARFLDELRAAHPDIVIFTHQTLRQTLTVVDQRVDGVCWSDFRPCLFQVDNPDLSRAEETALRLERAIRRHGLCVAAYWASPEPDPEVRAVEARLMAQQAKAMGYLCYYGHTDPNPRVKPRETLPPCPTTSRRDR